MEPEVLPENAAAGLQKMQEFLIMGGPAIWAIAALSVITLTLILWKIWRLLRFGAWSGGQSSQRAVDQWQAGDRKAAMTALKRRRSLRARLALAAMEACANPTLTEADAKDETGRTARALLTKARGGLRGLELAATIGPLVGLLGTVTGMISAFQALQEAGARADPSVLAGGIWEALLTTAAGMAVAIPAQIALTWFESVVDTLRHDMEDMATRIFVANDSAKDHPAQTLAAAE
ncbi:flagellar motor protein MotA [Thioclava sp. SK-1]|uniref:MotA/TolQ/ExbB proton channel family protein n=1 Tax=Thioclava sp. SK-1 TaxID=1889770 RepID=UPI0008240A11|nr:MotA/TolQ/ExbB proton channel family protein [Thioclava sp. SK-1]OCX65356.1 flagellar motor protein MotA [Thioclava sp. SK-1]